ncbi:hypothetical protein PC122_g479 [Phytophthora cactorum]|nr:hypothetical protein PC122_g479 [Phytophthora cactorum]
MLKIGDSMKRIFIASSDPDECEWIKEELEDFDVGVIEMRIKGELGPVSEVNTHTETEVTEKVTIDSVMIKRSEVDETSRESTTEESEESSGLQHPMDEPCNVSIDEVGNTRKASDKLLKVLANKEEWSAEECLKNANEAMYKAKSLGKNRVVHYNEIWVEQY